MVWDTWGKGRHEGAGNQECGEGWESRGWRWVGTRIWFRIHGVRGDTRGLGIKNVVRVRSQDAGDGLGQ